ncbi:hypothetical protein [Amycolatopsis sp. RTGN1]|uniref:hypothetical protein n=1 Tax=Amycolatopsis ponsaeliensis TaxID=2992142 RepID=UPI0025517437|nr:hypothetical protein [Amycolatopsis sp. RTGN1]
MTVSDRIIVKVLKRVQNVARTRQTGEPHGMTRAVPGKRGKYVAYEQSVVEAVEAAAGQLAADLRFEHLDQSRDELWKFVDQCQANRKSDRVQGFVEAHARAPFTTKCRVEIDYLKVEQPVDIFGVRLTPVNMVPLIRRQAPSLGTHSGCMAEVEVTGTNLDLMRERARSHVERALRVLRVAFLDYHSVRAVQLRFRVGAVAELYNGAGEWRAMADGTSELAVNRPTVEALADRPTARLTREPTSDIEEKANVALSWIERAMFADDPLVAMLYQFFALEAILGDKSSGLKGEQLAFRRATLSHAVTGGFNHPATALWLYEDVRNNAVHGTSMPEVSWALVQQFASDVRAALNEYLTFAESQGFASRGKLMYALDEHPDRQQLVDWLRDSGGPRWERFVAEQTTAGDAEAPQD